MLIAFKPWHRDMMRLTSKVSGYLRQGENSTGLLERLAGAGLVYTIIGEEGGVLGVAGAVPTSKSVAEVFVISAEDRRQHRIEFVRSVRQILNHAREQFTRIEALGEDTPFFSRWFTWLGFTCQGPSSKDGLLLWSMSGVGGGSGEKT